MKIFCSIIDTFVVEVNTVSWREAEKIAGDMAPNDWRLRGQPIRTRFEVTEHDPLLSKEKSFDEKWIIVIVQFLLLVFLLFK